MSNSEKHILLLGVEVDLFKSCFGQEDEWPCKLQILPEDCKSAQLDACLSAPGLIYVVFQEYEDVHYYERVKKFYKDGGCVAFFGIYGEFAAPTKISQDFGLTGPWSFSGYTKHEYILTPAALSKLGDAVKEQQYSKANLVKAPVDDRLLVPRGVSLDEYIDENCYSDDEDFEDQKEKASTGHADYCESLGSQSPFVIHEAGDGGAIAYLGFVNGDGNIPNIVRAVLSKGQTVAARLEQKSHN